MRYIVLTGNTLSDLMDKVNAYIAKDWEPQGGIAMGFTENVAIRYWAQAMTTRAH